MRMNDDKSVPNSSYFSGRIVIEIDEKPYSNESLEQPSVEEMYSWQVRKDTFTSCMPDVVVLFKESNVISDHVANVIKPKVQLLLHPPPRQLPKQVEEERRRRKYEKQNLQEMLKEANITYRDLLPIFGLNEILTKSEREDKFGAKCSLFPLEWFDDEDLDLQTPVEWLNIEPDTDGSARMVPAYAFLPPPINSYDPLDGDPPLFEWKKVFVHSFDGNANTWLVEDIQTKSTFNIPRIYLKFYSEDGVVFVNRLAKAIEFRKACEIHFRFGLVVDSMTLIGTEGPLPRVLERVDKFMKNNATKKIVKTNPTYVQFLEENHVIEYQRLMIEIELRFHLKHSPEKFELVAAPAVEIQLKKKNIMTHMENRDKILRILKQFTLYCLPQPYNAMKMVVEDCQMVSAMFLFTNNLQDTASLAEFSDVQTLLSTTVLRFLQDEWNLGVASKICMCLRDAGKGWFDITLDRWNIFAVSKIYNFMELVKLRMQSALRDLILNSTKLYEDLLCIPCKCLLHVEPGYYWGVDVIYSPFKPPRLHVFYLILEMSEEGAFYSTDPDEFEPTIIKLYDDAIHDSHFVHLVTPMVMGSLIFSNDLYLSSVGLIEKVIEERRQLIIHCYRKALIPLKAYSDQYKVHTELYMMDVDEHILTTREAKKPSHEIKEEISFHFRMRENLEVTLPLSITIGPFLVNVEPLRTFLIDKRTEIIIRMLTMLTEILKAKTVNVVEEYEAIFKMLSQKPESIEHIFEIREWMETLYETVKSVEEAMRTILFEYEILDGFLWPLPDEDFKFKWDAVAWPNTILNQVDLTKEMHEVETELFMKQQTSDEATFTERVEGLNVIISAYASQFDTSKTTELSLEISKNWKVLEDLLQHGHLLNKRQALFELPPIDLDDLTTLMKNFIPYRTLWTTGAEFSKWKEAWCGNPLSNTEIETIEQAVAEYQATLDDIVVEFEDSPNLVEVNRYFYNEIEAFKACVDVMKDLKNPSWLVITWVKLAMESGLPIKYTPNLNFETCLEVGIMEHASLVKEMSIQATIDKMQSDADEAEQARQLKEREDAVFAKRKKRMDRTDI